MATAANRSEDDIPQLVEFKKFMKMKNLCDDLNIRPDSYVLAVVESMDSSIRRTFLERCFQRFGSRYYVSVDPFFQLVVSKVEREVSCVQILRFHSGASSPLFPSLTSHPTVLNGTGIFTPIRNRSASTRPFQLYSSIPCRFSNINVSHFNGFHLVCLMLNEPVLAWDFQWFTDSKDEIHLIAIAGVEKVWLVDGNLLSMKRRARINTLLEVVTQNATTLHVFKGTSGVSLLQE